MAKFELLSVTTDSTPYKIYGYELVPRQPIVVDVPDEGVLLEDGETIELTIGKLFLMLNQLGASSVVAKNVMDNTIRTKLEQM